jgi:hypothetical protein
MPPIAAHLHHRFKSYELKGQRPPSRACSWGIARRAGSVGNQSDSMYRFAPTGAVIARHAGHETSPASRALCTAFAASTWDAPADVHAPLIRATDDFLGTDLYHRLAARHDYAASADQEVMQGSAEWKRVREKRITGSNVAKAVGLMPKCGFLQWKSSQHLIDSLLLNNMTLHRFGQKPTARCQYWQEMLELKPGFAGNKFTQWGSEHEKDGVALFKQLADSCGMRMMQCAFDVLRGKDRYGNSLSYIGASPDGLLETVGASTMPVQSPQWLPHTRLGPYAKGILEIKCPHRLCASQLPASCWWPQAGP